MHQRCCYFYLFSVRSVSVHIQMQRTLLSQIEETDKKLSHTAQDHSELQKELSEANNKISQACLVSLPEFSISLHIHTDKPDKTDNKQLFLTS